MVCGAKKLAENWRYEIVSIAYPKETEGAAT
jgi:hypothetical protein